MKFAWCTLNSILFCSYLPEHQALGTAGGLYHYRDQIQAGSPTAFFVFNADVCCSFQLKDIMNFHQEVTPGDGITIVATEVFCIELCEALASLDELPRICRENEGNSSSGAKRRNFALSHSVI